MTKSEFVQRVAIALAGNPKFVEYPCKLNYCDIVDKADALADTMEDRSRFGSFENEEDTALYCISSDLCAIRNAIGGYDDDGDNNIKESLESIRKYLNNPNDNDIDISAPQEIAKSIWDIEGHLRNIADNG